MLTHRKLLFIALLFLLPLNAYASNHVDEDDSSIVDWSRTYGGAGIDVGSSMQRTKDGGYVISGYTDSFGASNYDVYLLKTDSEGNLIWNKTYGGAHSDLGYSVQETSDGGYIVAGMSWPLEQQNPDFYLLKADSDGNELWSRSYTGPDGHWSWDWGRSVLETGEGGYILIGETYSEVEQDQGVLLVKTDSLGNLLWSRTYGGADHEYGYSILETGDGGYVIAGKTKSFGAGEYDVYIVKTKPLPVSVSISCQASVDTVRMGEGETISGKVAPPIAGIKIALTYTRPDGSKITRDVETDGEGIFRDRYVLDVPGVWNASPSIEDDVHYTTAGSSQVSFTVKEAPRQPLHLYGSIAAIATIIILGVWLLLWKRDNVFPLMRRRD